MQPYVCGFAINERQTHVVLIEKRRPEWQAGRYNGVGGHVEQGESPSQAMRREFREEAGLDIPEWNVFCVLSDGETYCVHFFYWVGDISGAVTCTDETVVEYPLSTLGGDDHLPNLGWLLPMALAMPEESCACFEVREHTSDGAASQAIGSQLSGVG